MFRITQGKGFHMTFSNGYTISVQWGPGNYCDQYASDFMAFFNTPVSDINISSKTAEIAIFDKSGKFATSKFILDLNDDVKGHLTVNEVFEIMKLVATA